MTHRRRIPRSVSWALAALVALVAVVGVLFAILAPMPVGTDDQVRAISSGIRCPVCVGESIADSTAPVARAMRDEVERQVRGGASGDDVRAWFADAYGVDVLLTPPLRGAGLFVWLVPLGVAAAAVAMIAAAVSRRGLRARRAIVGAAAVVVAAGFVMLVAPEREGGESPVVDAPATEILAEAARARPGDVEVHLAYGLALANDGDVEGAIDQFAVAHRLRPVDTHVGYLYASALLRDGQHDRAGATLDALLGLHPDHAPALLMRGMMLWTQGDERGRELLEDFLRSHPDDPMASDVRELLDE